MEKILLGNIAVQSINTALPKNTVSVQGIQVPTAVNNQTASDLAYAAARAILSDKETEDIGVLVFLTATPDYRSPATAMIIQNRLGIDQNCIVYDVNISSNGFTYGLQIAGSLLKNSMKSKALLVFGDTPSKQFDSIAENKMLLADGATAICLTKTNAGNNMEFYNLVDSNLSDTISLKKGGYRGARSQGDLEPYSGLENLTNLVIDTEKYSKNEFELLVRVISNFDLKKKGFLEYIFTNLSSMVRMNDFKRKLNLSEGGLVNNSNRFQLLGSLIPFEICKLAHKEKLDSLPILAATFGEGLSVSAVAMDLDFTTVGQTIYTDGYFDNGEVTHQI